MDFLTLIKKGKHTAVMTKDVLASTGDKPMQILKCNVKKILRDD